MRGCYEFLGGQAVVLFLTIQMSALLLCSVKTVIIGTVSNQVPQNFKCTTLCTDCTQEEGIYVWKRKEVLYFTNHFT